MKKPVSFVLILIIALFAVNCYAAPSSVNGSDAGNIANIVIVKKPETAISSTTKQIYTVSAVSVPGVEIAIYKYNPSTGLFDILTDSSGNAVVATVGASGLFVRDIELSENTNYLLIRAQYGSLYQAIRFDITLLNQGLLDSIKGFSANFKSVFGAW
ncbi:MAG: hypothetical protein IJT38_03520 [Clostridia bacterium]|nr:hypothetical protein [Clostridia bacterium]